VKETSQIEVTLGIYIYNEIRPLDEREKAL